MFLILVVVIFGVPSPKNDVPSRALPPSFYLSDNNCLCGKLCESKCDFPHNPDDDIISFPEILYSSTGNEVRLGLEKVIKKKKWHVS